MLGEYLDAIGLIIFYESLPDSSYNPIKLIMFCYLLRVRGTGYHSVESQLTAILILVNRPYTVYRSSVICRMTSPLPA